MLRCPRDQTGDAGSGFVRGDCTCSGLMRRILPPSDYRSCAMTIAALSLFRARTQLSLGPAERDAPAVVYGSCGDAGEDRPAR